MQSPIRSILVALVVMLAFATGLTACGQKGDLYLPDETGQTQDKAG